MPFGLYLNYLFILWLLCQFQVKPFTFLERVIVKDYTIAVG